MPIATLSVVCTLKGACQYTLFDVRGVEIHAYKRSKQCNVNVKAMLKVLKIYYIVKGFQCIKFYVCQRHQRWCLQLLHNTAYRVLLLILLMSKVSKMSNTMYSVYSGLLPLPGGKAICYSTVFEKPSILEV